MGRQELSHFCFILYKPFKCCHPRPLQSTPPIQAPTLPLRPSHVLHFGKALVQRSQRSTDYALRLRLGKVEFCRIPHRLDTLRYANPYTPAYPPSPYSIVVLGIVIVLFFKCIGALLNPANGPMGKVKWGLVVHTVAMFSFVTAYTATLLDTQSISSIDNRQYPGDDMWPPGPIGYQFSIYYKPITVVPSVLFALNQWLADGLLVSFVLYNRPGG